MRTVEVVGGMLQAWERYPDGLVATYLSLTPREWCLYYIGGAPNCDPVRILYKVVNHEWVSPCGLVCRPGLLVEPERWDGGETENGPGLHVYPNPREAIAHLPRSWRGVAVQAVAVQVRLADLAVFAPGKHPAQARARRGVVLVRCDLTGKKVES